MEISKGTTRNNLSYLLTALLPNKEGNYWQVCLVKQA